MKQAFVEEKAREEGGCVLRLIGKAKSTMTRSLKNI